MNGLKGIEEIEALARKNGNCISYTVILDILKYDNGTMIDAEELGTVLLKLQKAGVEIEEWEDTEDYIADEVNSSPTFIPADVHIMPRTVTIDSIVDRLEYEEIDLKPKFQRKGGLWSDVQQSKLIESLMLNIPIPTFYFNASDENNWIVIDGLQRLTTLQRFMVDKSLKLVGLEYLKDFEGYGVKELPRQYYRRIKETQIQIYTIEKGTPDDIVFNIFKRINTGGLILSPQEIRHALYQGVATDLVQELSKSEEFLTATGNAIRTDRMMDCEYITRYLAFTELDYKSEYLGSIDDFLIKALKKVNTYKDDTEKIETIRTKFQYIMRVSYDIFDKYAFRKIGVDGRRGPINKAIFEMWVVCLDVCTKEEIEKLKVKRNEVIQNFTSLLQKKEMISAIKASDKYSMTSRIKLLEKMVRGILDDK